MTVMDQTRARMRAISDDSRRFRRWRWNHDQYVALSHGLDAVERDRAVITRCSPRRE